MLLHALLDETVDEYFPVVDDYSDRADLLEALILQDANGEQGAEGGAVKGLLLFHYGLFLCIACR